MNGRKRKSNNAKYETSKITQKLLVTDYFVIIVAAAIVVGAFSATAFFSVFAVVACNGDILTTTGFCSRQLHLFARDRTLEADTEKITTKNLKL